MECPFCKKGVSLFAKSINVKEKTCPHCSRAVVLKTNIKKALLYAVPLVLIFGAISGVIDFGDYKFLRYVFPGIAGAAAAAFSFELREPAEGQG